MSAPFVHEFRVRYSECDVQGVVFNSHYLAFVDLGITELWREAVSGGYNGMLDRGVDVVVAEAHLRFRSSARFDDLLRIEITVVHLGTTSIVTRHRICRGDDVLVEVESRHVTVSRDGYTKTPMPDWLRSGLARWLEPGGGGGAGDSAAVAGSAGSAGSAGVGDSRGPISAGGAGDSGGAGHSRGPISAGEQANVAAPADPARPAS